MFPDVVHAKCCGKNIYNDIDKNWLNKEFIPRVQKRGAEIIGARGKSSAASAGNAAIAHMRDWYLGTNNWVSMGVKSKGDYGITEGLIYSFPVTVSDHKYSI